jgi:hypothetical protein
VTHNEAHPDKRPEIRKERRYDPLPLDPCEPDILRAKQLMDVSPSAGAARIDEGKASESDMSSTTSDIRIAILSSDLGGRLQALLKDPVVSLDRAVVAGSPELRYV